MVTMGIITCGSKMYSTQDSMSDIEPVMSFDTVYLLSCPGSLVPVLLLNRMADTKRKARPPGTFKYQEAIASLMLQATVPGATLFLLDGVVAAICLSACPTVGC